MECNKYGLAPGERRSGRLDAKKYLSDIKFIKEEIKMNADDANEILLSASFPSATSYDKERVDGSPEHPFDEKFIKPLEERERLLKRINELLIDKQNRLNLIYRISDSELRLVLLFKYNKNYSFEKIAEKLQCSERRAEALHGLALQRANEVAGICGDLRKSAETCVE